MNTTKSSPSYYKIDDSLYFGDEAAHKEARAAAARKLAEKEKYATAMRQVQQEVKKEKIKKTVAGVALIAAVGCGIYRMFK